MTNEPVPSVRAADSERQRSERSEASRQLPIGWALFAGLVGPAVAVVCFALEPAPADPNAPEPLIASLLGLALMVAWGGAVIAAFQRRPAALSWANVVGGLTMALTITCPLSGHHNGIGMWWVGQFVVSGAAWGAALIGQHTVTRRPAVST